MSERTHVMVQQWLQMALPKNDLSASLQKLSETFPYFSAAHILRLKQADVANENFAGWKKEAALHVYNPLQLENWMDDEIFQNSFDEKVEEIISTEDTTVPIVPEETVPEAAPIIPEETIQQEEVQSVLVQSEPVEETSAHDSHLEEDRLKSETPEINWKEQQHVEPELKIPAINLQVPKGDITFEPYHTVDYFASQGIKLSKTEVGNDQFGKQLKSFTDWLKTMKKLPTTAITQNTDGAGERKVENLAAHSLQNTDIITESMAEVWLKQGNLQKASEVYNKLSLQNPSKKAYFAAKIESLKKPS